MKKILAIVLTLAMVLGLSTVALAETNKYSGEFYGIYIDSISNYTLNALQLADMQANGLVIPVTGYVGFLSGNQADSDYDNNFPKLKSLKLEIEKDISGTWDEVEFRSKMDSQADQSALLTDRAHATGKEFTNFNSNGSWSVEVEETGSYIIRMTAVMLDKKSTAGDFITSDDSDTEDFLIEYEEVIEEEVTVYPMAAPNIAEIILEAEGVNANQSTGKGKNRISINLIQLTAAHMNSSTTTYFQCDDFDPKYDGGLVPKSIWVGEESEKEEVMNPDYWEAVLCFLNKTITSKSLIIQPLEFTYDDYVDYLESQE
jgi:uncharacterized protein YxeA